MLREFDLDKKSTKILLELAKSRRGNESRVIREAILYYAEVLAFRKMEEAESHFATGKKRLPKKEIHKKRRSKR